MSEFDITIDTHANEGGGGSHVYSDDERANAAGKHPVSRRGDSADEIDPRKLYRDPSTSELRWYYTHTFAKTLVDKPIYDAFKHGFRFEGDDAEQPLVSEGNGQLTPDELLHRTEYVEQYQMAQIKARRDGFALLFIGVRDTTDGVHISPFHEDFDVVEITHTKVLTIDDLCACGKIEIQEQVEDAYPELGDNWTVRESGIVIATDIDRQDYREPIGYAMHGGHDEHGQRILKFVHKDRVQHITWNKTVDGPYKGDDTGLSARWRDERPLGEFEGDSILVQSYGLMKDLTKGNWAVMQALFRNAANLYAVHLPRDADDEEFDAAMKQFKNMNAKSELFVPGGPKGHDENAYEIEQYTSGDMVEPEEYFDVIFKQICANHEMTQSVLFGTQAGTVSGSETDIKSYFNKVERFRQTDATEDILEFVNRCKRFLDGRVKDEYKRLDLDIEWEALFKVNRTERISALQTLIAAAGIGIDGFVLTPTEAREIIEMEWAELELGNMTESRMEDIHEALGMNSSGDGDGPDPNQGPDDPQEGNRDPNTGHGGGMPEGHNTGELADDEISIEINDSFEY